MNTYMLTVTYLAKNGCGKKFVEELEKSGVADAVRAEEAITFARHLICPRPLIRAILDSGIRLTVETLGNITGCYERCLAGLRKTPGVSVPPEMNRQIRDQFADYVTDFVRFQPIISREDETPVADFGTYMDGYEE